MAKHEHEWILKETYIDPITGNTRGQLFTCKGCPEAKLRISIRQMMLEAARKGKTPESIVQKVTESA